MAPNSGEPDAAALRDRVADLEQTVADQQATIESLSSPPASRRGVLAALTGVAGAGALGAYSQRGAAQAAGQVGTQSEPVDVEAWDLTVQNQLASDLDAGGNSLTNVAAVETDSLATKIETPTDVSASRTVDVEYQNTNDYDLNVAPIFESLDGTDEFNILFVIGATSGSLDRADVIKVQSDDISGETRFALGPVTVPPNTYYQVSAGGTNSANIDRWMEWGVV